MLTTCQVSNANINKVYHTFIGGVLATSIIVLGNGTVAISQNYDCLGQTVSYYDEKTNIYTSFTSEPCISFNIPGYSDNEGIISGTKKVMINELKLENLKKLEEISLLRDNWNANGAKAFSASLISKARNIILFLEIQPEVFPTACDSLQLEYDKPDGTHMEIELTKEEWAEIFMVDHAGCESIRSIQASSDAINKVVNDFYG